MAFRHGWALALALALSLALSRSSPLDRWMVIGQGWVVFSVSTVTSWGTGIDRSL
jgi:hypothetical protein